MQTSAENKKYEFVDGDTKKVSGRTLHRIRALAAIAAVGVQAGDLGGYVETEANLAVSGNAWVSGDAWVSGNARVYGNAWVSGDARVEPRIHIGWCSIVGSEAGTLTWFRTKEGVSVNRGCFNGTLDEFEARVASHHGDSQAGREYQALIAFVKLRTAVWHKFKEQAAA
ncbi:hypothetical protein AA103196_0990 [Ameyamaea chiangmaiensis NBRC 103196]|uniref:Polymer-forming cytoskeletal protein n=1 Tax=Ameyamaea chiangmaiensis TaxID=442969 RepID=A0A850PBQ4_9PROT|nr:hypothetical protein [Ameyamaea chiangmaiensis]MBS4074616.1 hypothetical protein [Ameyamaea chiangmaiensis]NVN39372.1 hypothetical protein [Ameyamaea chiangmaiensis]GBQ64857.1 hypothetical protein AA103196_0990 [Ameyamaea chiangmaiensis NBRC 103196]